jgi:hypothetical protein
MSDTSAKNGAASRIETLCPTKAIFIAAASPPNPAPKVNAIHNRKTNQ